MCNCICLVFLRLPDKFRSNFWLSRWFFCPSQSLPNRCRGPTAQIPTVWEQIAPDCQKQPSNLGLHGRPWIQNWITGKPGRKLLVPTQLKKQVDLAGKVEAQARQLSEQERRIQELETCFWNGEVDRFGSCLVVFVFFFLKGQKSSEIFCETVKLGAFFWAGCENGRFSKPSIHGFRLTVDWWKNIFFVRNQRFQRFCWS